MRIVLLAFSAWLCLSLPIQAAPVPTPRTPTVIPNDPQWHKARKQLASRHPHKRWKALRWIAKQKHPAVMQLLLTTLQHRDAQTRSWALAGLAKQSGPRVIPALQRALLDKAEAVRLQALVALHQRQRYASTWGLLTDRSPLIRETVCKALAGQSSYRPYVAKLQTCLRDREAMVRLGTAESMVRSAKPMPASLRRDVLLVLRMRGRRPYAWRSRYKSRYTALWRIRQYRNRVLSYERSLAYYEKKARGIFDQKQRRCIKQHQLAYIGQKAAFLRWYKHVLRARRGGFTKSSRQALSRALLAYRACLVLYRRAIKCRSKYPSYRVGRVYRKHLKGTVLVPDAPGFFADVQSRKQLRIGLNFTADTTFDIFRNDIRPRVVPKGNTVSGPIPEGYPGLVIAGLAHWRIGNHWQLQLDNRFAGHYQLQLPQLSGLNNHFQLHLLRYQKQSRRASLFFFEEALLYTQNTADTEPQPTDYNGPRLVQHARIGAYWRWGRLYRRWSRQEEWTFRIEAQNQIRKPLHPQVTPEDWPLTMHHQLVAKLEKQLFFFRMGLKSILGATHPLVRSAMIPSGHITGALTFAMGDIYQPTGVALIRGEIGYRALFPFDADTLTSSQPTKWQSRQLGYPHFKGIMQGHLQFMPLTWRLIAEGGASSSLRGPYSHFTYTRIAIEGILGPPPTLYRVLARPRQLTLRIDWGEATFGARVEEQISNGVTSPVEPSIIRDINITVRGVLPFWKGLRLVASNRLTFQRNSFVPIRAPQTPTTPIIDTVRNVFMIQLEYLWQGETK